MASICVHRAPRTPPDIAPGHISARGDLHEEPQLGIQGRSCPESPFFCKPSDTAIAILGACRAHRLARWHRFVSIEHSKPLLSSLQGTSARAMICWKIAELPAQPSVPYSTLSCNSSDKAIAILEACRAHRLARWHRFVSIERRGPLQTCLLYTSPSPRD